MALLTSSRNWDKGIQLAGIFDRNPKRNPWAGAHLVYLPYCSSDAWVGDAGQESNSWGFVFRGQRIIAAALAQLQDGVPVSTTTLTHYPNHTHSTVTTTVTYALAPTDRLLFGGCSAGARGAMFTLDYVQSMLAPGAPPVMGFLDSPLWVDVAPLEANSTISLESETQAVFALVNASARLGDACAAAYPGAEGWKCLYGQYRIPYVATPYLLSASQFDRFQLPYNEGSWPPYEGGNLTYANGFQAAVRSVALNLPTAAQPRSAVYSSACFKHCTSTLQPGSFWGVRVGGVSLKAYFGEWYFGSSAWGDWTGASAAAAAAALPPGVPRQRIEACSGFGCGQCHARDAAPAPPLPPTYTSSLLAGAPPLAGTGGAAAAAAHAPARRRNAHAAARDSALAVVAVGMAIALASRMRVGPRAPAARHSVEMPKLGEETPLMRGR